LPALFGNESGGVALRIVESLEGFAWPAISVVTRTKGRLAFLRRCIESVQQQSFRDFVHVIYSDGEPLDPIRELLSQLAVRGAIPVDATFLLRGGSQSLGIAAAGNAAMEYVQSKYSIFLDDDDTWQPTLLYELHESASRSREPEVVGAVCRSSVVKERLEPNSVIKKIQEYVFNPELSYVLISDMVHGNMFPPNSFLFRVELWRELGGFRVGLGALEDWDFNIRYLMKGELEVVPKPLANWHIRVNAPGSQTMTSGTPGLGVHGRFRVMLRNQYLRDAAAGKMDPQIAMLMQIAQVSSSTRDFMYGQVGLRPLWRKIRSVFGV
jgi:glycosyltransferase involved in cell wall biosynthesis